MLGAWCPWVMLSQEHRLRFYKEPLEDPVQTLQPGLGFYLHKEAMHGTFPAVKISSLPFQKKKMKPSPQPTVLPTNWLLRWGCQTFTELVLVWGHFTEAIHWTFPWKLSTYTWLVSVARLLFYNLLYTIEGEVIPDMEQRFTPPEPSISTWRKACESTHFCVWTS